MRKYFYLTNDVSRIPNKIKTIDDNNLPRFLINNAVYIDKRICSMPDCKKNLINFGFNLYTVYRLIEIIHDGDQFAIAMLAHNTMSTKEEYLCVGVPLAYIRPRDIGPENELHYLAISSFCPWCGETHFEVLTDCLRCKKSDHVFTVHKYVGCLKCRLTLTDNSVNIAIDIINNDHYINGHFYKWKINLSNNNYLDTIDYYKSRAERLKCFE